MVDRTAVFAFPGDLATLTGGYAYDRQVIAGLEALGWKIEKLPLGDGYPFPVDATKQAAEAALLEVPAGTSVIVDGLALGALPGALEAVAGRLRVIALVHHPLCLEDGGGSEAAARLEESERKALSFADEIIVTSPATAVQVADLFGHSLEDVHVIVPGTEAALRSVGSGAAQVRLLSVGSVIPRKGHDLLVRALSDLKDLDWQLDIVGNLTFEPEWVEGLKAAIRTAGLTDRISFHGAVPMADVEAFYAGADIFVLPSRYEGYGMAYTEALARGLPVIGSGAGAVRETLPEEGAIYCGVEDVDALKSALELLIANDGARQAHADAAWRAARDLPTWQDAAERFASILETP